MIWFVSRAGLENYLSTGKLTIHVVKGSIIYHSLQHVTAGAICAIHTLSLLRALGNTDVCTCTVKARAYAVAVRQNSTRQSRPDRCRYLGSRRQTIRETSCENRSRRKQEEKERRKRQVRRGSMWVKYDVGREQERSSIRQVRCGSILAFDRPAPAEGAYRQTG